MSSTKAHTEPAHSEMMSVPSRAGPLPSYNNFVEEWPPPRYEECVRLRDKPMTWVQVLATGGDPCRLDQLANPDETIMRRWIVWAFEISTEQRRTHPPSSRSLRRQRRALEAEAAIECAIELYLPLDIYEFLAAYLSSLLL